jgi:inner membrane protein
VLALIIYPVAWLTKIPIEFAHAASIGYFTGYFADCFTQSGVELFWPSPVRAVCPGNRNLRLRTNSPVEYGILIVLVALAIAIFSINSSGGILTQFNRLLGTIDGVEQLYNQQGGSHMLIAHIKGVLKSDRTPIQGEFLIIQGRNHSFIVQSKTGELYQAGTEADCQILVDQITADSGPPTTTEIEVVSLDEDELRSKLEPFNRAGAIVYVSGHLAIKDNDQLNLLKPDPYQFPTITTSSSAVALDVAPLAQVISTLGEEFATGRLSIRSIYANKKTTASINLNP